eukprot:11057636-Lingulodinium_polyedra.AAC.1
MCSRHSRRFRAILRSMCFCCWMSMPRPATVTSRSLSDAALRWIVRPSECSIWRSCVSPRSV